jgi:hypothetical protein
MSNAISLRLYNVLGTAFDDEATTDALHTLSELYAVSAQSKDGNCDLADEDEDEDAAVRGSQSVRLQETVPGETAARARKHLRRDMERKLVEGSRQFLRAFAEVDEASFFDLFYSSSYGLFSLLLAETG